MVVQSEVHSAVDAQLQNLPEVVHSLIPQGVQSGVQPLTVEQVHAVVQSVVDGHLQPLAEQMQLVMNHLGELGKVVQKATTVNQGGGSVRTERTGSKSGDSEPVRLVHSVQKKQESELPHVRVPRFIREQTERGHEPSLTEIMNHCACSKNTAIRYRRELLEVSDEMVESQ